MGSAGSSPPAMPITMTWSIDPADSARWVAWAAKAGPMPVTSDPTHHRPATPAWEKIESEGVVFSPNDFTIALSSGCIGTKTATRFIVPVTASSCPIIRYPGRPRHGERTTDAQR